jgi:N-acetylglucosamine kinase-like BadF-type ATPase
MPQAVVGPSHDREPTTRETVYLGVDGGQTGTRAVALDATGSIKAIVRAPGLIHPLRSGGAKHLRSVLERVRLGLPAGSPIGAAYLALTGVEGPESPSYGVALQVAADVWPDVYISVDNDGIAAWAGGTGRKPGVAAMAGTGSVVVAVNEEGERVRTGGWGATLGDPGGGWRIGLAALQQMLHRWDAGSEPTDLDRTLLNELGVASPAGIAIGLNSGRIPRLRIVRLAAVIAAAAVTDPAARGILESAAAEFAIDVAAALSRLEWCTVPVLVVPIGNVFRAGVLYRQPFERALASRSPVPFRIGAPLLSSAGGAALMSLALSGLCSDDVVERLVDSELAYEVRDLP